MPRIDNQAFYTKAIARYGHTAKGLNWNSKTSQQIRFEIIYELLEEHITSSKIIDAGCGFGDFYLFLKQKGRLPRHYMGYDMIDTMLHVATKKTGQKYAQCDILKDELEEADFYIASGSMNILNRFETHLFIHRCWEVSRKGFVFNLLKGEDTSKHFNYWSVEEILQHLKAYDGEIIVKEGYMESDFTVLIKKGEK